MNNYVLKISPQGFSLSELEDHFPIYVYRGLDKSVKDFQEHLKPLLKKHQDCDITVVNNGIIEEQLNMMFFEIQYTLHSNGQLEKIQEGTPLYFKWLGSQLVGAGFECEIICETTGDYVKVTGKREF